MIASSGRNDHTCRICLLRSFHIQDRFSPLIQHIRDLTGRNIIFTDLKFYIFVWNDQVNIVFAFSLVAVYDPFFGNRQCRLQHGVLCRSGHYIFHAVVFMYLSQQRDPDEFIIFHLIADIVIRIRCHLVQKQRPVFPAEFNTEPAFFSFVVHITDPVVRKIAAEYKSCQQRMFRCQFVQMIPFRYQIFRHTICVHCFQEQ